MAGTTHAVSKSMSPVYTFSVTSFIFPHIPVSTCDIVTHIPYCILSPFLTCYTQFILFLPIHCLHWCFRGSHMHSLVFHRLQHTVRPCSTFRWKGIATSANRSPYMYSYVTLRAYLSQRASTVRFHWEQPTVH